MNCLYQSFPNSSLSVWFSRTQCPLFPVLLILVTDLVTEAGAVGASLLLSLSPRFISLKMGVGGTFINKEIWKGRTSLWSSAWRCNISSKEGNLCNFGISRGQWVSTFCWLNISSNSIWHFNRSVQITSVSLLEVQSCFSQCNVTGLNHYPLWNLDFWTLRPFIL